MLNRLTKRCQFKDSAFNWLVRFFFTNLQFTVV